MKIRWLFITAGAGILAGLISVYIYNEKAAPQPPIAASYNPYENGVYATGIVESFQPHSSNINIYPEVSGTVTNVFVSDGQTLTQGTPLFSLDDSVQKQIVAKDLASTQYANANLVNVQQQLDKTQKSYNIDHQSVSQNTLDTAVNAVKIAVENLNVAKGQYGADKALLDHYIVRAPIDGMVFRMVAATGDYVSPQGIFDTYTTNMLPAVQMGVVTPDLEVRCYLDEILVPSLPDTKNLEATLYVRGQNTKGIPLQFVSIQPYTIPNIELSNERAERVDVRVLPIIFKFKKPTDMKMYPGQLVDIYIKGKK